MIRAHLRCSQNSIKGANQKIAEFCEATRAIFDELYEQDHVDGRLNAAQLAVSKNRTSAAMNSKRLELMKSLKVYEGKINSTHSD